MSFSLPDVSLLSLDFQLDQIPTAPPEEQKIPKKILKAELEAEQLLLSEFQARLYAHGRYGVLVCLQGMDSSGKDSLVREVFKDFNARGMVAHSFKKPTEQEYRHDFLWRHYAALPERGKFSVFNRSHYENVLITRVHPELILQERLPHLTKIEQITDDFWDERLNQIKNFENHITKNGIIIFKFFLHISKYEQKKRLIRRLEHPQRRWKYDPSDISERQHWDKYQQYTVDAILKTHTKSAPWYIIPSDSKPLSRLLVARVLRERLSTYTEIKEPDWNPKTQGDWAEARAVLERLT
ncbi:MAG: PPK2 family polyphosphate kinase [Bernardetiaceae bacterium]